MATKYRVDPRTSWSNKHGLPRLSDHVVGGTGEDGGGRWDERMPADSRSPERVLRHSTSVAAAPRLPAFGHPDSVRVAECVTPAGQHYQAVFVVRGGVVTTVLRLRDLEHMPTKSYLNAVTNEHATLGSGE